MERSREVLGDNVVYCGDIYETAEKSDCIMLMTEWDEFRDVDWKKIKGIMAQPVILDGRNLYDPEKLKKLGFKYAGIGRKV